MEGRSGDKSFEVTLVRLAKLRTSHTGMLFQTLRKRIHNCQSRNQ